MSDPDSLSEDPPGTFLSIDVSGPIEPLLEEGAPDTSAADETHRRRLQHILAEGDKASTAETIPALLELGAKHLDVENGHLAEIDPAEGVHRIVETSGPHSVIEEGATADLSRTFCRKLMTGREALAVQDAANEGWEGDPAYETYGLSAYVGAKIVVKEDLYGTVCFVGSEPRTGPLSDSDETFLELVTKAISRELRRRWREEQGRRTRARLEALFEGSPDMISVHDLEGNLSDSNLRLLEKTGYDAEELRGMKVWDLDQTLSREEIQGLLGSMEPGEQVKNEGRFQRKDGTTFPVEVHLRRLDLEGEDQFMAIGREVTERKRQKRAAQRLREKYEGLLKGAPNAIVVSDTEGEVREVNEAAASLVGLSAEDLEGRHISSLHPPSENGNYEALFRRHLQAGSGTETLSRFEDGSQVYLRNENGEHVPVEASIRNVELAGESRIVGIFRDIRERRERERRYEAIFNQTYQFTGLMELDGTLIEANDAALDVAGTGRQEVIGKPIWEAPWFQADESDPEKLRSAVGRARAGEFVRYEETIQGEEGTRVIDFSIRPITGEDGEVRLLIPEGRDITDRKTRERELERLNDLFGRAQELADIGAWEYDVETEMSIRTDGLREIYGLPKDSDLTVAQEMELYHPDDRPRLREALSRALEERVSYDLELRLITESGEERWVRVRGEPQVSDGAVVRVRGTVQDITEQKRREEALREAKKEAEKASRLKSAMLANMNHEIRTPLTSVKGFADLMREELGGQMGKFAEQIHTSSERLMRTLDSVLRLSKLESEIDDIERTDVDLTRMTRETAELLRPSAKKKQVALETNLPAGEVRGKCNEGALDRIMENLIENAIKFTPEGGAVTVRLREEQEEAVLEIEDTGVGIAKPAQAEIFDAFQQESEGLGREFEGSGLGLSIVKRLVEAQGGTIEVESEKGEGSRFTARLPKPEPKGLRDG